MVDVNKSTRRKLATLVTDEEVDIHPHLSGDFPAEGGIFGHLRRAEILVPDEVYADYVVEEQLAWYGTHFEIGIVPPEQVKVTSAEIRLSLEKPVKKLGAWYPNDVFSAYRKIARRKKWEFEAKLDLKHPLLEVLPDIKSLLPQLSAHYMDTVAVIDLKLPEESVIRTMSDGQRRLVFQLSIDPKTEVDPRKFNGQLLFGITPDAKVDVPLPAMRLEVSCRCGALRLRSEITQVVEVTFRGDAK